MSGHIPHSLESLRVFDSTRNILTHYTCNAPSQEVLDRYNIVCIGDKFGCSDKREVLEIPLELYTQEGWQLHEDENLIKINLEKLMRDLTSGEKNK